MKISIGTNYFGQNERQDIARQTHSIIQKKHPNVKMYNIQFEDETESWNPDSSIENLHAFKRSSKDILPEYDKKLPFVKDAFDILATTDCDAFVYINSDILLTDRLPKYISGTPNLQATTSQRLDIRPIKSLNDDIFAERFEIAGFDTFIFNKEWYLKHNALFEDYLLGKVWFDHAYALIIKVFGGNQKILNYLPNHTAHIYHGQQSHLDDDGNFHNKRIYENSLFKNLFYIWDDYFRNLLLRRQPMGRFLNMLENEINVEKEYFETYINKEKEEIERIKGILKIQ
jgi:hypothetical protein